MTKVVNLYKEPYDIYIGRGSPFGNPFVIGWDGNRQEVIDKYREWFYIEIQYENFRQQVLALRGKVLGCFCFPKACHGNIIVEWLNEN